MEAPAAIEFRNVVKIFPARTPEGREQRVLDGVSLTIPEGKTTVIAGGSGQGKSVTLKLILGLLQPDAGQILVDGVDIATLNRKKLNEIRSRFGVLFQGAALFDSLTVYENVAMPLRERTQMDEKAILQQVMATLAKLDLAGHEQKYPAQLSGGMRKRVGLARALQLKPRIILFDEPTTGLDPLRTAEIYQLLVRTRDTFRFTSVLVSHDIPKVFNLADQIVILLDGQVYRFNSPEELLEHRDGDLGRFLRTTMGSVYCSHEREKQTWDRKENSN